MIFSVLVTSSCVTTPTLVVCQFTESSGLMILSFVDIEGYAGTNTNNFEREEPLSSSTKKEMQQQILCN